MLTESAELLQNLPLFGGIKTEVIKDILSRARLISCQRGEYFFLEGEAGSTMYVLRKGQAAILKTLDGHKHYIRSLHTGDCFGEMAIIECCNRSASVVAEKDAEAIEITTDILSKIYQKDLEQFTLIQMNMGREVSRRLRELSERFFQLRAEMEKQMQPQKSHSMSSLFKLVT